MKTINGKANVIVLEEKDLIPELLRREAVSLFTMGVA
jgi:hypothetical protein